MVFSTTLPSEVAGDEMVSYSSGEDSFVIINEEPNTGNAEDVVDADQEISKTEACDSGDVNINRETLENEILEAIRQAGLDDKFWIKKIREEFKVETVEELKNVTKEQVEQFLQNTETTIQSRLCPVFSNLMGVEILSRESVNSESVDVEIAKPNIRSSQRDDKIDTKRADEPESKISEGRPIYETVKEEGSDVNVEVVYSREGLVVTPEVTVGPDHCSDGSTKPEMNRAKLHDAERELENQKILNYICQAVEEAGLDDKVWVPEIQENLNLKNAGQLKSLSREKVEVYLQSVDAAEQDRLREVFEKLLLVDYSQKEIENMCEKHQAETKLSAGDFNSGDLCRGILFTADLKKLLEKKEKVIEVSGDGLKLSDTSLEQPIFRQEFVSKDVMRVFVGNIDKHMSSRSTSIGVNIWGVDLHDALGHSDKEGSFVGCVSYQFVRVNSVTLSPNQLDLTPKVIAALQELEQAIISKSYAAGDYFSGFFEKCGSHVHNGVVEFGGMLVGTAECSGFKEEDRSEITNLVTFASEKALSVERTDTAQSFSAYKMLGEISGISGDILQNITVTVNKVWDREKKIELKQDTSQWSVVNRSSSPMPIWKMLRKYKTKFKDHKRLADLMREEWNRNIRPKQTNFEDGEEHVRGEDPTSEKDNKFTPARRTKNTEEEIFGGAQIREEKQLASLQIDINEWIKRYCSPNSDNLEEAIASLSQMKHTHRKLEQLWQEEVLYLYAVQRTLIKAVKFVQTKVEAEAKSEQQLKTLTSLLKFIIEPVDKIQSRRFPDLRLITQTIDEVNGNCTVEPFHIEYVEDIVEIWQNFKGKLNMNVMDMQLKLESTMKSQYISKTDEYLIFVGVLQIFGFDISLFRFGYQLSKDDVETICKLFEMHLKKFRRLRDDKEKQAHIFQLVLYIAENREAALRHMLSSMKVCSDFEDICRNNGNVNLNELKKKIQELIPADVETFTYFLQSQLRFLHPEEFKEEHQQVKPSSLNDFDNLSLREMKLLDAMGLKKYYPGKLTLDEVITLTAKSNDVNSKPGSLLELPWYYIKHLIGLDSDTRENCHVEMKDDDDSDDGNDSSDSDNNRNEDQDTTIQDVHPLDLEKVIMLCADDFLRQELIDKMVRCQYAVPLIIPMCQPTSRDLVLHWSLKGTTRTYCHNNKENVTKNLGDLEAPLVTFMNLGEETSWKSRLLNKMLSSQQETFWNQELSAGHLKQRISKGMVEIAWYLPGSAGDNKFKCPIAFANMRGNAAHSDVISDQLLASSSLTYLFAEDITTELEQFLQRRSSAEEVVIVLLHRKCRSDVMKEKVEKLKREFCLKKEQVIRRTAESNKFDVIFKTIKKSIDSNLADGQKTLSVTKFASKARSNDHMEVDDRKCHHGQIAAEAILADIDEWNTKLKGSAKSKVLPFQSDLTARRKIVKLEKEYYRQSDKPNDKTMEGYAKAMRKEKLQLQLVQLQEPLSSTFKYFLQNLTNPDDLEKKYFLECLRQGLNKRSMELLQPWYNKYEECRLKKCKTKEEIEQRDRQLKELDDQLTNGSFGIEHFFREIGVLYENLSAFKKITNVQNQDLNTLQKILPNMMAKLWIGGTALEIMDGDAVHIPTQWLKAVMNKVEKNSTARIFKLCVVGAQGCGKSTLLNTTFGLSFPVSSGRCTRGAYMQLVKIDETLKEKLKCDYIAVIDSEGLMSRVKLDGSEFDNELATFVIGLSDLTLVVNKDEGSEMQDVLPMAILVFLRMKPTGEQKACHFVIEKRGALGGMAQQGFEIDKFVSCLNEATSAAAEKADQSDQYQKFADVLQYSATRDNTYIPILCDGTEMGKTFPHHMKATEKLKAAILSRAVELQHCETPFNFYTFCGTATRLEELSNAIKSEYVVLGFKSVLALKSHGILSKIFNEQQWEIKRQVRQKIQTEIQSIENELVESDSDTDIRRWTKVADEKLTNYIHDQITNLRERTLHYFQCGGCHNCNRNVDHRDQLANNKKEFEDDINALQRSLLWEVNESLDNLTLKMRAEKGINQLAKDMDDILRRKVQETIKTRRSENLEKEAIVVIFNALWKETGGEILRDAPRSHEHENIQAAVQVISSTHRRLYNMPAMTADVRYSINMNTADFTVQKAKHMQERKPWKRAASHIPFTSHIPGLNSAMLNEQDVKRLQDQSENIIELTKHHYYSALLPEGRKFDRFTVEGLFKDVITRVTEIYDDRFKITNEYKMDLLNFVEMKAISGFINTHELYCRNNSPGALLEKKRMFYYELFEVQMLQGDFAVAFCNAVLKKIILTNIEKRLSCTELLHVLRQHPDQMFLDIKHLHAWILKDLAVTNKFKNYIDYITNYEGYVKRIIKSEAKRYFTEDLRMQALGESILNEILKVVREVVNDTVKTAAKNDSFTDVLLKEMNTLEIPHKEIGGWKKGSNEKVPGHMEFANFVHQQLDGALKDNILQSIYSWNVSVKLRQRNFQEFVFKEIVGCGETCPFCKAPCDAHSGGIKEGKHSARLHRPEGLGAFRWVNTEKLVSKNCCQSFFSKDRFRNKKTEHKWVSYTDYKTVYPDWDIELHADPDYGKYWKWVFANHNTEFAQYYSAKEADIPIEWIDYTKEEAIEDAARNLRR